jgi:hypothetical protein
LLSVDSYPKDHVERCRQSFASQLAAYRTLTEGAAEAEGAAAVAGFAPLFFANLVLALDEWFLHRSRTLEGKNGGPLNEVRLICEALVTHDGVLTGQRSIKYDADKAVLGLALGEHVLVTETGFVALVDAFLADIEVRFAP